MYRIFHRTWWVDNKNWPTNLEPCIGESTIIQERVPSIDAAIRICTEWNETHAEGRLARRAEFVRRGKNY